MCPFCNHLQAWKGIHFSIQWSLLSAEWRHLLSALTWLPMRGRLSVMISRSLCCLASTLRWSMEHNFSNLALQFLHFTAGSWEAVTHLPRMQVAEHRAAFLHLWTFCIHILRFCSFILGQPPPFSFLSFHNVNEQTTICRVVCTDFAKYSNWPSTTTISNAGVRTAACNSKWSIKIPGYWSIRHTLRARNYNSTNICTSVGVDTFHRHLQYMCMYWVASRSHPAWSKLRDFLDGTISMKHYVTQQFLKRMLPGVATIHVLPRAKKEDDRMRYVS